MSPAENAAHDANRADTPHGSSGQPYSTRRVNVAYAALQIFFWCAYCSFFSFLILYLLENGYPRSTIGWMMTMLSALSVVVPQVYGYLSDFHWPVRRLVSGGLLLSIPAVFLVRASIGIVPLAFLTIGLMGVLERSLVSVIDSWGMKLKLRGYQLNYAMTRGFASVSFAFAALGLGVLYDRAGISMMFWMNAFFAILAVAAALTLAPVAPRRRDDPQTTHYLSYGQALQVLRQNRPYRRLVAAMFLVAFGQVASATLLPIKIAAFGGSNSDLGRSMFVMAVSEFPAMLLYQRVASRFRAHTLVAVGMIFVILRVVSAWIAPSISWLITSQVFQMLSLGLYLPALLHLISEITDARVQATAITFAFAAGDGLSGLSGNAISGYLADRFGLGTVYGLFAILVTAGFVLYLTGLWRQQAAERAAAETAGD